MKPADRAWEKFYETDKYHGYGYTGEGYFKKGYEACEEANAVYIESLQNYAKEAEAKVADLRIEMAGINYSANYMMQVIDETAERVEEQRTLKFKYKRELDQALLTIAVLKKEAEEESELCENCDQVNEDLITNLTEQISDLEKQLKQAVWECKETFNKYVEMENGYKASIDRYDTLQKERDTLKMKTVDQEIYIKELTRKLDMLKLNYKDEQILKYVYGLRDLLKENSCNK